MACVILPKVVSKSTCSWVGKYHLHKLKWYSAHYMLVMLHFSMGMQPQYTVAEADRSHLYLPAALSSEPTLIAGPVHTGLKHLLKLLLQARTCRLSV